MLKSGYEDEMKIFFNSMSNGEQVISSSELIVMMKNLGETITEEEANYMISEADIDNDGFVNYEGLLNQAYS